MLQAGVRHNNKLSHTRPGIEAKSLPLRRDVGGFPLRGLGGVGGRTCSGKPARAAKKSFCKSVVHLVFKDEKL